MFRGQELKKVKQLLKFFADLGPRYRVKLRSWEDFQRIPLSDRESLKSFAGDKKMDDVFNIASTSGSTSTRMLIAHSENAYRAHKRRLVKMYRQFGIQKGVVCLNLCSYDLNSGGRLMESGFKAAGAGVIPLGPISTPEKIAEAVTLIKRFKPSVINAYTNQMFDLFSALGRKHSIDRCLVTGELLWPSYRNRMEKLGDVKIHDHYGAMEFSGLAMATHPDDEYMKVFSTGLLLEVLDEVGVASRTGVGELLVTDLDNYCMPFIRYRLGDRVELKREGGGLGIKVLGRITGSLQINGVVVIKKELIRTCHELIGHPNFFFLIEKNLTNYSDQLTVYFAGASPKNAKMMAEKAVVALGLDRCIVLKPYKKEIPRTTNGKIRYFIDRRNK